jgi:predicted DNA-binding transcriptional regulator AlpA
MDARHLHSARVESTRQVNEPLALAYSVNDAAKVSGLSRAFIYAEWHAGRGPRKVKAGRRTLITPEALRSWLCSLECGSEP